MISKNPPPQKPRQAATRNSNVATAGQRLTLPVIALGQKNETVLSTHENSLIQLGKDVKGLAWGSDIIKKPFTLGTPRLGGPTLRDPGQIVFHLPLQLAKLLRQLLAAIIIQWLPIIGRLFGKPQGNQD